MTYLLSKSLTVYIVVSKEDDVTVCRRTTFDCNNNEYVSLWNTKYVTITEAQTQLVTECRESLDKEINLMESK